MDLDSYNSTALDRAAAATGRPVPARVVFVKPARVIRTESRAQTQPIVFVAEPERIREEFRLYFAGLRAELREEGRR